MQLIQPKAMKWTTATFPFSSFMVSGLLLIQSAMSSNSGAACSPEILTGVHMLGSSLSSLLEYGATTARMRRAALKRRFISFPPISHDRVTQYKASEATVASFQVGEELD